MLLACASGTVVMNADGSCVVRGIVLGRAEIVAYRAGSTEVRALDDNDETSDAKELCARVGGGAGSAGLYGAWGAFIGMLAGAALF